MSTLDKADAARALGMKQNEIHRILDTDAGPVVVTQDGVETLVDLEAGTLTFLNRGATGATFDPSLIDSASAGGAGSADAVSGPAAAASIAALGMAAEGGKVRPEPDDEDIDEEAVARRAAAGDGPTVPVVTAVPPTKADGTARPEDGGDAARAAEFDADQARRDEAKADTDTTTQAKKPGARGR